MESRKNLPFFEDKRHQHNFVNESSNIKKNEEEREVCLTIQYFVSSCGQSWVRQAQSGSCWRVLPQRVGIHGWVVPGGPSSCASPQSPSSHAPVKNKRCTTSKV